MAADWVILHAGALGDLVLMLHLALRLTPAGVVRLISRTDPGDLSACQPAVFRRSSEGLGSHWLYAATDDPPPETLRAAIAGQRVLSALGDVQSAVHERLRLLEPAALYSFDPRPRPGLQRHITQQWQSALESQGLLIPKCVHQRPQQRSLGVPEALRERGRVLLAEMTTRSPRPSLPGREIEKTAGCTLIHPGSGGREKCWPLASFVQVGRRLRAQGAPVCFLLGPAELERWPAADVAALRSEFPVIAAPSPDHLVALLGAAQAVIANDSGVAHLAALLGTRTVVIFGPTSAQVWRPLGADVCVVAGEPDANPEDWGIDADDLCARHLQPALMR